MKTRAAVAHASGRGWEIEELELDDPGPGEVLIRVAASGLCHTDEHIRQGDLVPRFPIVGGHEGAGVVEKVGPAVEWLSVGDHVVMSFVPICGHCRFCATGHSNLCDLGAYISTGSALDSTYRFHRAGADYGGMCVLGTFSQWTVVSEKSCVLIDQDISLEAAALLGCAVPTGWGSAVYSGSVMPGDLVVVYGVGGVGINAVQGALHAGASVLAVDIVDMKVKFAKQLGATYATTDYSTAQQIVTDVTKNVGADVAILTVGLITEEIVAHAFEIVRKGGTIVLVGGSSGDSRSVHLPATLINVMQKRIQGTLLGACNPFDDIPRLANLYRSGNLKIDELITQRYSLDQINDGYQDMRDGKNIRGLIVHEH